MTRETTASRVREVMAALFQILVEELTDETSPGTLPAWDSLGHLNLVVELEQEFGISLSPERVESMVSLPAVISAVEAELPR
jgi:acyl carrier protein